MLNDFIEYQQSFDKDPDNIFYFWQKKRRNNLLKKRRNNKNSIELDINNKINREDYHDRN